MAWNGEYRAFVTETMASMEVLRETFQDASSHYVETWWFYSEKEEKLTYLLRNPPTDGSEMKPLK
jgi:hypothetical protein